MMFLFLGVVNIQFVARERRSIELSPIAEKILPADDLISVGTGRQVEHSRALSCASFASFLVGGPSVNISMTALD